MVSISIILRNVLKLLRTIFRLRGIEDKSPGSQSALSPKVDLASSRVGSAQAVCTCRKEKSRNVCKATTTATTSYK